MKYPTLLLTIIFSLAGFAKAQTAQPATAPASKYLRFVPDVRGGTLQTSTVHFENSTGATVDLIAAIHIADAAYFRALNDSFKQYDAVLYELVSPLGAPPPGTMPHAPTTMRALDSGELAWVHTLQIFMRDQLHLSFQLQQIDYTQPNFIHADLDLESFQRMQADRGESMLSLMFQQIFSQMAHPSSTPQPDAFDLFRAWNSPDRPRQLKLLLAQQMADIDEMSAGLHSPNGSVILDSRNQVALMVLRRQLEKGNRHLAIFYGAAHLATMEKKLIEMDFKQIGEPQWRIAWDMTK